MPNNTTELTTKLTLDDKEFKNGITNAANRMGNFAAQITKASAIIAGLGIAAAGVAFHSLAKSIEESTERVSQLVDASTRLGVGIPALQSLHYAAQQSGISTGELDSALGKMQRTLQNAVNGGGDAISVFNRLGLNFSELSKLPVEQQYIAIGDAIKELKSPLEQTNAALSVFGKAGVAQLSLLKDNARGLVEEYHSLGVELTTGQAQGLESYGDSVRRIGVLWEGFKDQVAAALAGPLKGLLDWVVESIKEWGGLRAAAIDFADGILGVISTVLGALSSLSDYITSVRKNLTAIKLLATETTQAGLIKSNNLFRSNKPDKFQNAIDEQVINKGQEIIRLQQQLDALDKKSDGNIFAQAKAQLDKLKAGLQNTKTNLQVQELASGKVIIDQNLKDLEIQKQINGTLKERSSLYDSFKSNMQKLLEAQKGIKEQEQRVSQVQFGSRAYADEVNKLDALRESTGFTQANQKKFDLINQGAGINKLNSFIAEQSITDTLAKLEQDFNKISEAAVKNGKGNLDPIKIEIQTADGLVAKVVTSSQNRQQIQTVVSEIFGSAARQELR